MGVGRGWMSWLLLSIALLQDSPGREKVAHLRKNVDIIGETDSHCYFLAHCRDFGLKLPWVAGVMSFLGLAVGVQVFALRCEREPQPQRNGEGIYDMGPTHHNLSNYDSC